VACGSMSCSVKSALAWTSS